MICYFLWFNNLGLEGKLRYVFITAYIDACIFVLTKLNKKNAADFGYRNSWRAQYGILMYSVRFHILLVGYLLKTKKYSQYLWLSIFP